MVITKDKNNNILQIEPNGVVISTNYIQTERDENMSKNNLIELEGKIISISSYRYENEYIIEIEAKSIKCDTTNNSELILTLQKRFNYIIEYKNFYKDFQLDDRVNVDGFLDGNLKFCAKNIYFIGGK